MWHVLRELREAGNVIENGKSYHDASYVVVRLVTILESALRYLSEPKVEDAQKVDVPVMTLRTALNERHASPDDVVVRMLQLSVNYQSVQAVSGFLKDNKPFPGRNHIKLDDGERAVLDRLFESRHRVVHSIDALYLERERLREYHKAVSGLVERLIESYWAPGLLYAKALMHEWLGETDMAKKCHGAIIESYAARQKRKDPLTLRDAAMAALAYCELGMFEESLREIDSIMAQHEGPEQYHIRAYCLVESGHLGKAVDTLRRGLEKFLNEPSLLESMSDVQFRRGDKNAALEYAMLMLGVPEKRLDALRQLATVYKSLGQSELASILRGLVYEENESVAAKRAMGGPPTVPK